jgi:hypothetical protein
VSDTNGEIRFVALLTLSPDLHVGERSTPCHGRWERAPVPVVEEARWSGRIYKSESFLLPPGFELPPIHPMASRYPGFVCGKCDR